MPELDSITVQGFKSISKIENLKLNPINVIIGPNGSGKSNFIGVFSFLRAIRVGLLQDYVGKAGGANNVLHFGVKTSKELRVRVSFQGGKNQYEIALEPTELDELVPSEEWVYFWNKAKYPGPYGTGLPRLGKEAGISAQKIDSKIGLCVRGHLDRWRLYHFHDTSSTSPMKMTGDLNDNRFLRPDGSNLAAFLYYLRLAHETSYRLIQRAIQRVGPFFDDFVLEPRKLNPEKIRLEWRHTKSDAYFDASSLSDGTLRFIALATLLLQPDEYRPSVTLVDEPELGLHPFAVTLLASLVRQASVSTQVILSTQSPLLLDNFAPEEVLVADLIDGSTNLTRLDPEKLSSWLENYSLGQLWEKNEIGGRPGRG